MPARVIDKISLGLAGVGTISVIIGAIIAAASITTHDIDRGFIVMLCGVGMVFIAFLGIFPPRLECIKDEKGDAP